MDKWTRKKERKKVVLTFLALLVSQLMIASPFLPSAQAYDPDPYLDPTAPTNPDDQFIITSDVNIQNGQPISRSGAQQQLAHISAAIAIGDALADGIIWVVNTIF